MLHYQERSGCSFHQNLLGNEFEIQSVGTEADFSARLRQGGVDVVVFCFCAGGEASARVLARLVALAGPIPVVACFRTYDPSFIQLAASRGVTNFLLCDMDPRKIREFVLRTLRVSGLRGFLESHAPAGAGFSPHAAKMIDEIVRAFPKRLTVHDVSRRLGITTRRLQTVCRETFDRSFTHLLRLIWVHQALTMMRHTSLDNTEIALRLDYQEESSLARIFRKELGYGPSEARHRLVRQSPEELLDAPARAAAPARPSAAS